MRFGFVRKGFLSHKRKREKQYFSRSASQIFVFIVVLIIIIFLASNSRLIVFITLIDLS